MTRALRLYAIGVGEGLHRLRHDLARELVVGVSSLVLFATFLYVFNDFLNVQVKSLSEGMRGSFARGATAVVLLVATGVAARAVRAELYGERSLRRTAVSWGEDTRVIWSYLGLRFATVVAVVHGVAWWAVERWLVRVAATDAACIEAAMLVATAAMATFRSILGTHDWTRSPEQRSGPVVCPPISQSKSSGPVVCPRNSRILRRWRVPLLLRSRTTKVCFALALPFLVLSGLAGLRGAPPFVAAVATYAAGYLAAVAFAFRTADDTREAWIERGLGVTHDEMVTTYEFMGWGLGLAVGVVGALLYLAAAILGGAQGGLGVAGILDSAAKVVVMGALPAAIVPMVLYQIDARRPAITLLVTLITSLFVSTAVLAHWLGLLLVPLLRYYALRSQAGRFYRA